MEGELGATARPAASGLLVAENAAVPGAALPLTAATRAPRAPTRCARRAGQRTASPSTGRSPSAPAAAEARRRARREAGAGRAPEGDERGCGDDAVDARPGRASSSRAAGRDGEAEGEAGSSESAVSAAATAARPSGQPPGRTAATRWSSPAAAAAPAATAARCSRLAELLHGCLRRPLGEVRRRPAGDREPDLSCLPPGRPALESDRGLRGAPPRGPRPSAAGRERRTAPGRRRRRSAGAGRAAAPGATVHPCSIAFAVSTIVPPQNGWKPASASQRRRRPPTRPPAGPAGSPRSRSGRDVGERAGDVAVRGEALLLVHQREPEVEQLDRDAGAVLEQDVGRLDVAVDDPVGVRVRERPRAPARPPRARPRRRALRRASPRAACARRRTRRRCRRVPRPAPARGRAGSGGAGAGRPRPPPARPASRPCPRARRSSARRRARSRPRARARPSPSRRCRAGARAGNGSGPGCREPERRQVETSTICLAPTGETPPRGEQLRLSRKTITRVKSGSRPGRGHMSEYDSDIEFDFFDDPETGETPPPARASAVAAPAGGPPPKRPTEHRGTAAGRAARRPDRVRDPDRRPARPLGAELLRHQQEVLVQELPRTRCAQLGRDSNRLGDVAVARRSPTPGITAGQLANKMDTLAASSSRATWRRRRS